MTIIPKSSATHATEPYLCTVELPKSLFVKFVKTIGESRLPRLGATLDAIVVAVAEVDLSTSVETANMHRGRARLSDEPVMNAPTKSMTILEEKRLYIKKPIKTVKHATEKIISLYLSDSLPKNKPDTTPPAICTATAMPAIVASLTFGIFCLMCVEILLPPTPYIIINRHARTA